MTTLKQMALTRFEDLDSGWRQEPSTIFHHKNCEVWIRNEKGFCTMQGMVQTGKRLTGRQYSKRLTIGYYDPGSNMWVESEHLEKDYPTWVQESKRTWGVAR